MSDTRTLTCGVLGRDVGSGLLDVVQRLALFDDGTDPQGFATAGPFSNPLTDDQKNFQLSLLDETTAAFNQLNEATAVNGVNMKAVEEVQGLQDSERVCIKGFISDIEDVDAAEAISKPILDNVTLGSSFRVFSQLTRPNLIDFL